MCIRVMMLMKGVASIIFIETLRWDPLYLSKSIGVHDTP